MSNPGSTLHSGQSIAVLAGTGKSGRRPAASLRIADSFVDLVDVAAVAARVLTGCGYDGRTYELTGPESIAVEGAVDVIAAGYVAELRATGTGEAAVEEQVGLFTVMAGSVLDAVSADVPRLLGRPARPSSIHSRTRCTKENRDEDPEDDPHGQGRDSRTHLRRRGPTG